MSDDKDQIIADLKARIAALEAQNQQLYASPPATAQPTMVPSHLDVSANQNSSIADVQMIHGNRNMVLKQIIVAAGGALVVREPAVIPPDATVIEEALAIYLSTLLNQYRLLSFQGLSASAQRRHAQIALQAVFINVPTNVQIPELQALVVQWEQFDAFSSRATTPKLPRDPAPISADLRQWLIELLGADLFGAFEATLFREVPRRSFERLTGSRTALELIRHEHALVLTGDPGSGKTTVLRYLAWSMAWARLHADQTDERLGLNWSGVLPLPVLVQLRRFADSLTTEPLGADSLLKHLEAVVLSQHLPTLDDYLAQEAQCGRLLVLLDGIDEIADPQKRRWVIAAIELFQARYPHCRLVVTSRIYAYVPPFQVNDHFRVAELQPLPPRDQDAFIERWYRAALDQQAEADQAASRARNLSTALHQRPRLREVAQNPLLLTLMTLLHFGEAATLPDQRAELYEKCLLLLLDEWDMLKGGRSMQTALGLSLQRSDLLPLIQPVAFELQQRGREEASPDEVQRWMLDRFCDLTNGDVKAAKTLIERFLETVETRSGVLIARDVHDRYAFPHRTFQEYLAMREVVQQNIITREVAAQRHNPTWREVLLLLVGHLVRASNLVQARGVIDQLLDADFTGTDACFRNVALAGEMVEELGQTLDRPARQLKNTVQQELATLVEQGQLSVRERVTAALTLGRLGDPRMRTPDQDDYWCYCEAGPFWFGDEQEDELKQVTLPYAFKIGRFPITNAEYARFLDAGGYTTDRWCTPEGLRWRNEHQPSRWEAPWFNQPTQPVVGVTWYEAMAYCAWVRETLGIPVRLPTSVEWERAARGTDQRRYPWGNVEPTPEHVNYAATEIGQPTPVGCFPQGRAACGAEDLSGNVMEWLASRENALNTLEPLTDADPFVTVLTSYSEWGDSTNVFHCGARYRDGPYYSGDRQGFRLVSLIARV